LPLDELDDEEVDAVGFLDRVGADYTGVVEGGEGLCLAPEALQALGARSHLGWQHLERDLAPELRVGGAVDRTHPAGADRGGDPVVSEGLAGQGHHSP